MPIKINPFINPSFNPFLFDFLPDLKPKTKKITMLEIKINILVNDELTPIKLKKLITRTRRTSIKIKIPSFLNKFFILITLINNMK